MTQLEDSSNRVYNTLNDQLLQDNEEEKLSDKDLKKIYKYYIHKGYHNILLLELINLCSTIFMVFFILMIVKCIDYNSIDKFNKEENVYLWDFIDFTKLVDKTFFSISFIIIFGFYILLRILTLIDDLGSYHKIKLFLKNHLHLNSYDILHVEWKELTDRIEAKYNLNIYQIHSKILRKENLMIPVFNSQLNKFIFSKLMEWNLIYGIFNTVFHYFNTSDMIINTPHSQEIGLEDDSEQFLTSEIEEIKQQKIYFRDRTAIKKKCIMNFLTLAVVTYIFMPFLFIYVLFFSFLKYGERYYHNPIKIMYRQWSVNSAWKMRYYNEIGHDFDIRMDIASQYAKEYLDFNKSKIFNTIIKFLVLLLSSFFIVLLVLSIYNENILLHLNISSNKHVLWYLGILGSLIAIGRNIVKGNKNNIKEKETSFQKVLLYNPFLFKKEEVNNKKESKHKDLLRRNIIKENYIYQIVTLARECFSVLLVPCCLIYICNYVDSILDKIEEHLYYDEQLGFISYNSNFRIVDKNSNKTSLLSFKEFRKKYPEWGTNIEVYQLGDVSLLQNEEEVLKNANYPESIFDKSFNSELSII